MLMIILYKLSSFVSDLMTLLQGYLAGGIGGEFPQKFEIPTHT